MTKYGIDISKHNGSIDFQKVQNSGQVDFVILRAGYGKSASQKDSRFEEYYSSCKKSGIPVGAYWYSYAVSESEAIQEANVFLQCIQGKQFEYPLYFDIEEKNQFALGKTKCTAIAKAFLETIEKAGYFAGIYASKSNLETYLSAEIRSRYAVWVAHYGVTQTSYNGNFGMWQKSSSGKISGISGNTDLDECYVDYPSVIQSAGLNGFSQNKPSPKMTVDITIQFNGKTFSGTVTES